MGTHRLLVGGFWSRWTDMIGDVLLNEDELVKVLGPGGAELGNRYSLLVAQRRNLNTIRNYGLNVAYEGKTLGDNLHLGVSATLAKSRQEGRGVEHAPPTAPFLSGNAQIGYNLPAGWPQVSLAAHFLARRPADQAYRGGFDPRPFAPPQLELRATVNGELATLSPL